MKFIKTIFLFLNIMLIVSSCKYKEGDTPQLVSMQIIDKNGFSETIGSKDRLSPYKKVDFRSSQPYQKVLRVFAKNEESKSRSTLTTYHSNGQLWQYLEILDGRAHGSYQEWHPNGQLHIDLHVIDGIADTTDLDKQSWLFDGTSTIYDDQNHLIATIFYDKGVLETPALHYHISGQLKKSVPYIHGEIDGEVQLFDTLGTLVESVTYVQDQIHGKAFGYWGKGLLKFEEDFENDLLIEGKYLTKDGDQISSIVDGNGFRPRMDHELGHILELHEYRDGKAEGLVKIFTKDGDVKLTYETKDGMKHGEEWEYYPLKKPGEKNQAKIMLTYLEDALHGPTKTWYPNGVQESSKELHQNKKQGLAFAWYGDGSLMLSEEYHQDQLVKGQYFGKGSKKLISKVENGKGQVTLFDKAGILCKKIEYDNGLPVVTQN